MLSPFCSLFAACRARLRLTIQDKNKYNTPKYRMVVRFVRARHDARKGLGCFSERAAVKAKPLRLFTPWYLTQKRVLCPSTEQPQGHCPGHSRHYCWRRDHRGCLLHGASALRRQDWPLQLRCR